MNIFDHGTWSRYQPNEVPAGFPPVLFSGAIFLRSGASGADWYDYQRAGNFDAASIKATCRALGDRWIVSVATVEQSRLLPDGCRVIELFDAIDFTDPNAPDPQTLFGDKVYDPAANVLADAPTPPVVVPETASKLGLKRALDELGRWAQAKALIASNANTQEEWDLANEINRTDPIVLGMINALQLQPTDVDAILIRARELTKA
ncbi:hypothetical protein ACQR1W_18075 [Bradyrhizobium sp. HKCCYLS1011]|uniref:hypothetical protein n=1 Tax=Bradyrhizobium sp. HKCCYLS1011 TaxID=3420733 RepID=UPI003EC094E0